jgi:hypothetical protein
LLKQVSSSLCCRLLVFHLSGYCTNKGAIFVATLNSPLQDSICHSLSSHFPLILWIQTPWIFGKKDHDKCRFRRSSLALSCKFILLLPFLWSTVCQYRQGNYFTAGSLQWLMLTRMCINWFHGSCLLRNCSPCDSVGLSSVSSVDDCKWCHSNKGSLVFAVFHRKDTTWLRFIILVTESSSCFRN